MKLIRTIGAGLTLVVLASGCGGEDRASLATSTVKTYWDNVEHMKLDKAYSMITPGQQQKTTKAEFVQNWMGFLRTTAGVSVTLGSPKVNGDAARVPITLHSPKTSQPQPGCQQLAWLDGKWLISDDSGALSQASTCNG